MFILIFLAGGGGRSLTLFAWRAPKVSLGGAFALVSRETLLLINNVLLLCAAGAVLLGTLYPLVIDALNLGKLSVGPPYFNAVFAPLMVPVLFLMAAGPGGRAGSRPAWPTSIRPLRAGLRRSRWLVGVGCPSRPASGRPGVALGLGAGGVDHRRLAAADRTPGAQVAACRRRPSGACTWPTSWASRSCVVGIVMVKHYETERDVRMAPGDTVAAGRLHHPLPGRGGGGRPQRQRRPRQSRAARRRQGAEAAAPREAQVPLAPACR